MRDDNMILSLGGLECVRNSPAAADKQHNIPAAATTRAVRLPTWLASASAMRCASADVTFLEY